MFHVGCAPIVWNNEDLPGELGPAVSYEPVLDEIVAAGYSATELGRGFPRQASVLRRALDSRRLTLVSAWCGLGLLETDAQNDLEHARRLCDLLAGVGASYVNLAHRGTAERMAFACRADDPATPRLTPHAWDQLAERVCQAAEVAHQRGLQATFHLHAGTWVETLDELDQLLRRTPATLVKLCWDVGHAICGGIDPIAIVRAHPERIAYVHMKDVDGAVLASVRRDGASFSEAVRRRLFTELGRGILDLPRLLVALRDIDYQGWLMVEQDSTWQSPLDSARASRASLTALGV